MPYLFVILFLLPSFSLVASPYDEVVQSLHRLRDTYPGIAELVQLGLNDQGQEILGIALGGEKATSHHLVVATHHGNETGAPLLALSLAERLGKIMTEAPGLFDPTKKIFLIPVLNISGYNRSSRRELDASGTAHDPNRDYPDPCGNESPYRLKSTKALAGFIERQNIVSAITIHGYWGSFTFPWGTYTRSPQSPDHDDFIRLAMASTQPNGYSYGTHAEVIYPTNGAFEDWAYFDHGIWSMLVEMDNNYDLENDTTMALTYLKLAPSTRSRNHQHEGPCYRGTEPIRGRP